MNNGIWPKRLFALDISRGFAALSVVLWHWQNFAYNGTYLPEDFHKASQPFYAILKIFYEKGSLAVEYFFLLSGFVFFWLYSSPIENRSTNLITFWVQRISRLYPLHIVTLLIVTLLQVMYFRHNGNTFVYSFNDIYHFLLNLAFVSNWGFENDYSFNGPVWSVSTEILLYWLFFMAAYVRLSRASFCLGVAGISIVIYTIIRPQFIHFAIFQAVSLFFLGGFVFYITFHVSTRFRRLRAVIHIITAILWILTIVNFYVFDLRYCVAVFRIFDKLLMVVFPGILFAFTVCSLALIEIDGWVGFLKSTSWIGNITYSSYLLHFPIQLVFGLAVSYGVLNSAFYLSPVYFVVFFSILIPLSYITFIGFERPMQNIIRNKFKHRTKTEQCAVPATVISLRPISAGEPGYYTGLDMIKKE